MFQWSLNLLAGGLFVSAILPTIAGRTIKTVPIDISGLYNNKATSLGGVNDGTGMQDGCTYPSAYLPEGPYLDAGVEFALPKSWASLPYDNIRADSQIVHLPQIGQVRSLHLLASGEDPGGFLRGESVENLELEFDDGYKTNVSFELKNWYGIHWTNKASIRTPYRYLETGERDHNASHIFHIDIPLPPQTSEHHLHTITLGPPSTRNCLHVFAMSYTLTVEEQTPTSPTSNIAVARAEAIGDWEEVDGEKAQIVEITLINPNPAHLHHDVHTWMSTPIKIALTGTGLRTVRPGRLSRLMPGDQTTIRILIQPSLHEDALGDANITYSGLNKWTTPVNVTGTLVRDWTAWDESVEDLERHRSPRWFNGAKFGIFIHWGLYAVPAWADEGRYAEWYGYWLHGHEGGSAEYHKQVYGEDFTYDDFIPQFTGAKFNASAWVDLFAESGAKYFVLTTKHHDGFALFDTKGTSQRSSVQMGPKRDFVGELMSAAENERPELGRGTYYSMPEWWNPSYQKYSRELFAGGLARNPYHEEESQPYTGYVDVDDYIEDIQLQQMRFVLGFRSTDPLRILANDYKTDLMWCDIGLANHSSAFAAEWFADAARQGRHVSMNNRCGIGGDFDTPEMTQFANAQTNKWETCSSMDPHSFGYNRNTRPEEYRNASNIIHYIVDITAKGGNLLLNVGPNAEGEIVQAMTVHLLEAGKWLKKYGEAIYHTDPFFILPEIRDGSVDVRFTRTPTAFYIISLKRITPIFTIPVSLPILHEDRVTLMGCPEQLGWTTGKGFTEFLILESAISGLDDEIAWAIKIEYSAGFAGPIAHDEL